uniref:Immunoglobulin domain-containing protein n=1 Tax=Strigops habroptila TaxID=2489341 RepID=A0A672UIR7_STRHB
MVETEVVHALPGTDVTLVCSFPKPHTTFIIQTQWSKTDDMQLTRIAVYHPASYNFSSECSQWALHLKNVTISLSGQYECSFATYPYGTKAARIQLIVKAEEEQHYVKEVWLNQTLEIPCLKETASENLSNYPLKWLVVSILPFRYKLQKELQGIFEENGRKEELVTKEPSCPAVYRNSSMLYGQRVHLGLNNALKIFPTKITDDGRVFSCHVVSHPERVQKSSTTVRVFGKGLSRFKPKAFAAFHFLFFFPQGISVEQEDSQDSEGFYQLRSTLVFQGTHQISKMFLCACLFSFLGNETWNISSKEIFVSFALFPVSLLGGVRNTITSHFPWPTAVAVLLLSCSFLVAVGIRKWCQYQKEIIQVNFFSPEPPTSISLPASCFCSLILHGYLRTCFNETVLLG